MPKAEETTLEIDLAALEYNYRFLRSKVLPETRFMAVVKAGGYGSDMVAVARKLEILGVDSFAVAYAAEGVVLRDAGIKSPILVFHPQPVNFTTVIQRCLEPSIYSPNVLARFLDAAARHGQEDYPIHLKFNTGLNRLGFWENDIEHIHKSLSGRKELKIASVFSHLAASEDLEEKAYSKQQIQTFKKIVTRFEAAFGYRPFMHMLNTSGIHNYPGAQFDMVRSGIGLYGYGNAPELDAELKPISTLKTIISQLHKIEPGETVGYNRAFASEGYRITATLPIGHADGIGRHFGNKKTHVWINGAAVPIIGNVCMDMMMVDVTGIACKEGDEVIIFGPGYSADALAGDAGTISYELLTGISSRIKRLILNP